MSTAALPLAGYVRVSRQGERDDDRLRSPDFQRDAIARYAVSAGREIIDFDPEIDVSGSKVQRAVLEEVISQVEDGILGGVVVAKLDRLSRLAPRDRLDLFERIENAGGVVLSASESLDASTPEGRMVRDLFLGIARMQWERYRDQFDQAKRSAMEKNMLIGPTPFGYGRNADGTISPHPEQSVALARAFALAAREGVSAAATYLDALGLAHDRGKREGRPYRWTSATVRRMLAKRVYLGEGRYGKLEATVPALVERDVWEAAQSVAKPRKAAAKFPLSGLAVCTCGAVLVGHRAGKNVRAYRCSSTINRHLQAQCDAPAIAMAEPLEQFVVEAVIAAYERTRGRRDVEVGTGASMLDLEAAVITAEEAVKRYMANTAVQDMLDPGEWQAGLQALVTQRQAARDAYRDAAKAMHLDRRTRMAPADVLRGASPEELAGPLRGAVKVLRVRKGRGRLPERVSLTLHELHSGVRVAAAK